MMSLIVCMFALLGVVSCFRMPSKAAFHQRVQSRHVIPSGALETSSVLVADGALSAVAWPIAISVLTMVPFLYYQQ